MRLHRFLPFALALVSTLAGSSPSAVADARGAEAFIKERHQAVERLLQKPPTDKRDAALNAILEAFLDYDELAKRSLGSEWSARSEAERTHFRDLLKKLVERSYTNNLERTLDFKVSYLAAEESDDLVLVKTEARDRKNRRAPSVRIDYRVLESGGEMRVVDIVTDGVSLVDNYRRQFTRTLERESWDALIEKMERRLREGDETSK